MSFPHISQGLAHAASRRSCSSILAAVFLGGLGLVVPAWADPPSLTLIDAQRLAVERSRQIDAKDYAAAASRDMAVAAGQLPDPVLKAGIDNLPVNGEERFSTSRDFMTMRRIGVMQEITRGDKRRYRSERYEREAEKELAEKSAAIASIQRDVASSWLDLYYTQAAAGLVSEIGEQAKLEIQAAEGAYRGGRGTQAELLAAKSANTLFEDRMSEVNRRVANAKTMLARWIGPAARAPLGAPPAMDRIRLAPASLEAQLTHHPEIAVLSKQEEVAIAEANLAKADKKADWSVELAYQQRGSRYSDMVSLGVSIPLQWNQGNRQDRELAAKLARVEEIKAEREDILREHVAQTQAMIDEWENGKERLARYNKELIPLANGQTLAAIAAYRGAKGSLAEVLSARRNEIDTRLQALQLENDTARLWAKLNYLYPDESALDRPFMAAGGQQ